MKYPNNIKKRTSKIIDYANRGMTLENDLNITNDYYINNNIAIINKKATPIKIVKVIFDDNKKPTITEAYFQSPSTTDYNGIYKGKHIDFEAKEVKNSHAFPLNNINTNQLKHIKNIINHGGICFIVVRFVSLNKTYILKGEHLINFIEQNIRKSIPLEYFIDKGYEIKQAFMPRIDYIKIIDNIYLGGE